ncbi:MAG: hypothetical protein CL811_12820 [Colwelliaceae bacterium]|nr:hypothetical protein [Colwelliaceae bacterium]|tara:strand:- start:13 stop:495 length:483 start_codon:yes stop_codon:yes gene_type:complete
MREVERINKSIITADSIEARKGWTLANKDNPVLCHYCKSPLFYIGLVWGIVDESDFNKEFKVIGQEHGSYYMREVGLILYCAECGHFHEHYYKHFFPNDKIICTWDDEEIDIAEIEEIRYCIAQYNKNGDFEPHFNNCQMNYLKKKLREYEEANINKIEE